MLWMSYALGTSLFSVRFAPGQFGQHPVVGRQIRVIVAVGSPVEPLSRALVTAPPLDKQCDQHHHEGNFACSPGNSAPEALIAQEVGMPIQPQRSIEVSAYHRLGSH